MNGRALRELWQRTWFAAGSPYALAAARIVFALQGLWVLLSRDLAAISGIPGVFWAGGRATTHWRFLLFPGHERVEQALTVVAAGALIAAALGLAPRIACLASGLLLYHLAPLETIIWTDTAIERGFEVTILAMVVLAFAPCADVWALRARRDRPAREPWEYHWPLAVVQLYVAQIYLFAGYWKLRTSGLAWLEPGNLRRWFLLFTQFELFAAHTALGRFIAEHPALCAAAAVGAVALELSFIVVLVAPGARRVLVPLALLMHLGIYYGMNIAFLNAPQLLVFVNWDWVRERLRPRPRTSPPLPAGHSA